MWDRGRVDTDSGKYPDKLTMKGTRQPLICLTSSVRNAGHHLEEWFSYHRAIGITAFYVVDHRPSEDDTSAIIAAQPDAVVLVKEGPFDEAAWSAELCNLALSDGARALFPNDTDEFLTGTGAPFADRIFQLIHQVESEGLEVLHLLSPGFNVYPDSLEEDWKVHSLIRPNPLFTGKSAAVFAPHTKVRVKNGCQHRLGFEPSYLPLVLPDRLPPVPVFPLDPLVFPFHYLHFPFHGPVPFLRRVLTFSQGPPEKLWQMVIRYGEGVVDEGRRGAGNLTRADLETFLGTALTWDGMELYRQAVVDGGLPRAYHARGRDEFGAFFGQPQRIWSIERLEKALDEFAGGRPASQISEDEFLMWPIGSVRLVATQRLKSQTTIVTSEDTVQSTHLFPQPC